jgi:hypothetical protein
MKKNYLVTAILLAMFVNIGILQAQTCPSDMVAYWKLEEIGSTVLDDYISVHDATSSVVLSNVPEGKVGNAKAFGGAQSASVSDHPDFAFPTNSSFSVEFWVKIPSAPGTTQVIIGKRDSNSSGAYWFVGVNSAGRIFFEVQDSDGIYREVISPSSIANNNWRHVVAVRDEQTNANLLYVDGVLAGSVVYNYTGSFICNGALTLGSFNNSSGIPSYFFNGSIDEVAVFSRALTATEVTDHKALGDNGIGYCDGYSPSFISTPNNKATVGTLYSYRARATGLQTEMRYTLIQNPAGMVIDEVTGQINWTPASAGVDGSVSIVANNNIAPADTQSFRIFIAEAPDCPSGLGILLKLDESAGPEYADFYGNNNATALVSPSATTGIVEGGQAFDGASRVDVPDNGNEFDWTYQDNWSVEFWMKTSNSGTQVIVGRHRAADDYPDYAKWWIGVNGAGEATFFLQDNAAVPKNFEISGGPYLFDDQWHHVIAVREGSIQQNRIYVDGIEVAAVTTNYANSFKADLPTPVTLGYWNRPGTANPYPYTGALDEVAFFNKAISAVEAATFYNVGAPTGHCTPGNFAPIFTSTPVTVATQDELYSYLVEVDDADISDPISISAPVKPDWLTFNYSPGHKNGVLTGTPTNDDLSLPSNVTLRVSDGISEVDQNFIISFVNVNDPPEITSTPGESVDEDQLYTYTLVVEDPDVDDDITMDPVTVPSWLTFDWTAGNREATLSGTPSDADNGDNAIHIAISDGTVDISEQYTLVVNPVNDVPVISGQSDITIDEDESIVLTLSHLQYEDPDNVAGELTLTVLAGNDYTFLSTLITPDPDFNGVLTVPVTISDPESESDIFNVSIAVNAVNDPPVITSTPDLELVVEKLYAYSMEATDPDGDILTYNAEIIPDWMDFIAANGILTGTPGAYDRGQHLIILSVTDGNSDPVEQDFIVTVDWADGIENQTAQRFSLYPSPASEVLHLEFATLEEEAVAYLFSNSGNLVKSVNIPARTDQIAVDVSELESGSYYCLLRNSKRNQTLKFMIAK